MPILAFDPMPAEFEEVRKLREQLDLEKHDVKWMALRDGEYRHVERSGLIDLGVAEVGAHPGWE
jgi:hypothetical protein